VCKVDGNFEIYLKIDNITLFLVVFFINTHSAVAFEQQAPVGHRLATTTSWFFSCFEHRTLPFQMPRGYWVTPCIGISISCLYHFRQMIDNFNENKHCFFTSMSEMIQSHAQDICFYPKLINSLDYYLL